MSLSVVGPCPTGVLGGGHQFHVLDVDAPPVEAKMVYRQVVRDGAVESLPDQAVGVVKATGNPATGIMPVAAFRLDAVCHHRDTGIGPM